MTENKFNSVMVDIETMGHHADAAIISIAAVEFDIKTGLTGAEFRINVDLESCIQLGRSVSSNTIQFWLDQPIRPTSLNGYDLPTALIKFDSFMMNRSHMNIFANSPSFDISILTHAFKKVLGKEAPFMYNRTFDVRTISWLFPTFRKNIDFIGNKHDPIDDCKHQIRYTSAAYHYIKNAEIWKQ